MTFNKPVVEKFTEKLVTSLW